MKPSETPEGSAASAALEIVLEIPILRTRPARGLCAAHPIHRSSRKSNRKAGSGPSFSEPSCSFCHWKNIGSLPFSSRNGTPVGYTLPPARLWMAIALLLSRQRAVARAPQEVHRLSAAARTPAPPPSRTRDTSLSADWDSPRPKTMRVFTLANVMRDKRDASPPPFLFSYWRDCHSFAPHIDISSPQSVTRPQRPVTSRPRTLHTPLKDLSDDAHRNASATLEKKNEKQKPDATLIRTYTHTHKKI